MNDDGPTRSTDEEQNLPYVLEVRTRGGHTYVGAHLPETVALPNSLRVDVGGAEGIDVRPIPWDAIERLDVHREGTEGFEKEHGVNV